MENNLEQEMREKMIRDTQWYITYHTEKLAEFKMQLQILTSQHQPKNDDDGQD